MVSIEPPIGATQVGDYPDDDEENRTEVLKRELKARQQFADSMRLAGELQVRNQDELTRVGRNWADRLFDTKAMSESEFQGWRAYGVRLFGEKAGTAADLARKARTTRKDGMAVSTERGRIIAKDRRNRFSFTADPLRPRVGSSQDTEFAGIVDDLMTDPGEPRAATKDGVTLGGPGDVFDDMSRKARSGGQIDRKIAGQGAQAKASLARRAGALNLGQAIRDRVTRAAEDFALELDISGLILDGGGTVTVGKVALPEPTEGNDELDVGASKPEPTEGNDELDIGAQSTGKSTARETWRETQRRLREKAEADARGDRERVEKSAARVALLNAAYTEAFWLKIAIGARGFAVVQWTLGQSDAAVLSLIREMRDAIGNPAALSPNTTAALRRRIGVDSLKLYRSLLIKANQAGFSAEAVVIAASGPGAAMISLLSVEGADTVPPLTLTWSRSGSIRDHGAWLAGAALEDIVRSRIPADVRANDPEVRDALAAGEVLADLIPGVDVAWAPLIAAGETGSLDAARRELAVEMSVDGFLDLLGKVGGLWSRTLSRAIQKFGETTVFKAAKEVALEAFGDLLGNKVKDVFKDEEKTESKDF